MKPRLLTQVAHERLAAALRPGDYAVDATVGNGHDTLFLAEQVGETGHVWGFDVQPSALENAYRQLVENNLSARVSLIEEGHQHLSDRLPEEAHGRLAAVMFNLGYLPGSDKEITTSTETTLPALDAALANLKSHGMLSILAYRGHPGGQDETTAVECWLAERQGQGCRIETVESPGPILYLLTCPE